MASPSPIPGRCGAKVPERPQPDGTVRPGGFCTKWPMKGQRRCDSHGGKAKQNLRAAEMRQLEDKINTSLAKLPAPKPIRGAEAVETIERVLALTLQKAEFFNAEMDRLIEADDLTVTTASQGEQLKAVMLAGERWLKECRAAAADYVKLGMDARRLEIDKAQAKITFDHVVAVLDGAMSEFGLSPGEQVRFRGIIGEWLRRG